MKKYFICIKIRSKVWKTNDILSKKLEIFIHEQYCYPWVNNSQKHFLYATYENNSNKKIFCIPSLMHKY